MIKEAGLSLLASKRFDGFKRSHENTPHCLGDIPTQQFDAVIEHFLAMDDQRLSAVVAVSPKEMMEIGTTCQHMSEWHRNIAEAHSVLVSRIACCVARNIKRLEN